MSYNGWSNYETWCVRLWIDNEQSSIDSWREIAREIYDVSKGLDHHHITKDDRARIDLARRLKYEIEDHPFPGSGLYTDLLNAALSEVDWHEIATSLLKNIIEEV